MIKKFAVLFLSLIMITSLAIVPASAVIGSNNTLTWNSNPLVSSYGYDNWVGGVEDLSDAYTELLTVSESEAIATSDVSVVDDAVKTKALQLTTTALKTGALSTNAGVHWRGIPGGTGTVLESLGYGGENTILGTGYTNDGRYPDGTIIEFSFKLPEDYRGNLPEGASYNYAYDSIYFGRDGFNGSSMCATNPNVIYRSWLAITGDREVGFFGAVRDCITAYDGGVKDPLTNETVVLDTDHWYRFVMYVTTATSAGDAEGDVLARASIYDDNGGADDGKLIAEEYYRGPRATTKLHYSSSDIKLAGRYYRGAGFAMGPGMKLLLDDLKVSEPSIMSFCPDPGVKYTDDPYATPGAAYTPVESGYRGHFTHDSVWNYRGETVSVPVFLKNVPCFCTDSTYANPAALGGKFENKDVYVFAGLYKDDELIDMDMKTYSFGSGTAATIYDSTVTADLALSIDVPESLDASSEYCLKKIVLDEDFRPICEPEIMY